MFHMVDINLGMFFKRSLGLKEEAVVVVVVVVVAPAGST